MSERKTPPAAVPVVSEWGTHRHIQTLVLMVATALGIYLCYRLVLPFLSSLAWALALAVVFASFHRWVESKVKRPGFAAAISVLLIGVVVLVPATLVGRRLVQEAANGAELIQKKVESGEWRHALEAHPRLAPLADWMERQRLPEIIKTVATWMTTTGAAFVKGSVLELIGVFLTFYLLFFLLRSRGEALQEIRSLSPLSEAEMDRLFVRVEDTIFATIYGTVAVSFVQGLLGGLMFWWLGLPAPLLWGVVMALLGVVPVLGAFVVWIPAAVYLALDGSWGKALILAGWGTMVVGGIDNLLYPLLVGKRLKMHTVFVFTSVVGGLIVFGAAGLVLGPVIFTITLALLEVWRARTVAEAKAATPVLTHRA